MGPVAMTAGIEALQMASLQNAAVPARRGDEPVASLTLVAMGFSMRTSIPAASRASPLLEMD